MRTEGVAETILVVYVPVLALVFIALVWARRTCLPRLSKILSLSATFWLVILTLVFGFGLVTAMTCKGNFLYGYGDCTFVPQHWADASFAVGLLTYAAAAFYTTVLFAIGLVVEWIARNRR